MDPDENKKRRIRDDIRKRKVAKRVARLRARAAEQAELKRGRDSSTDDDDGGGVQLPPASSFHSRGPGLWSTDFFAVSYLYSASVSVFPEAKRRRIQAEAGEGTSSAAAPMAPHQLPDDTGDGEGGAPLAVAGDDDHGGDFEMVEEGDVAAEAQALAPREGGGNVGDAAAAEGLAGGGDVAAEAQASDPGEGGDDNGDGTAAEAEHTHDGTLFLPTAMSKKYRPEALQEGDDDRFKDTLAFFLAYAKTRHAMSWAGIYTLMAFFMHFAEDLVRLKRLKKAFKCCQALRKRAIKKLPRVSTEVFTRRNNELVKRLFEGPVPRHVARDAKRQVSKISLQDLARHVYRLHGVDEANASDAWKEIDLSFDGIPKSRSGDTDFFVMSVSFPQCGVPYVWRLLERKVKEDKPTMTEIYKPVAELVEASFLRYSHVHISRATSLNRRISSHPSRKKIQTSVCHRRTSGDRP